MIVMMTMAMMIIMMTPLQGVSNSLVFAIDRQTLRSLTPTNG